MNKLYFSQNTQILIILILVSMLYIPFVFVGTTGEYDSMRMVFGIVQSINEDRVLTGYNYNVSFAYFKYLELFRESFVNDPENIITVSNYTSAVASILFFIPYYILVKRYWGESVALTSSLVLAPLPIWWSLSVYGHPMIPSILLFTAALSLFTSSEFSSRRNSFNKTALIIVSILLFTLSLAFRLDVILLFPLLTAVFIFNDSKFLPSIVKSVLIGVACLALFIILQNIFVSTDSSSGGGFSSILERMKSWHNLGRFFANLKNGLISLGFGIGPTYLLLFSIGVMVLFQRKDYRTLFFLLPVSVINIVFWLSNPFPARHFIYIAPVIAIGIAILIQYLLLKINTSRLYITNLAIVCLVFIIGQAFSEAVYPLARSKYPWKYEPQDFSWRLPLRSLFINKEKTEQYFITTSQAADCLIALPHFDTPIVFIGDPLPTIMYLQMRSKSNISYEHEEYHEAVFYRVTTKNNTFIMPINHSTTISNLSEAANSYLGSGKYNLLFDEENRFIDKSNYEFNDNFIPINNCSLR